MELAIITFNKISLVNSYLKQYKQRKLLKSTFFVDKEARIKDKHEYVTAY